ncbi:Wzz/FepE/Etk N-terminal domain-containing protein [Patescibacteria group bacterium AH-259-L05]|nr:Wzz/FepE/Etk N-terminal domain-containing protein [Patescibacteria group bacterium AH-259-L05]
MENQNQEKNKEQNEIASAPTAPRNDNVVYEEEIDLRDYIDVLLKRKVQILAIFFAAVILTAVISLTMPETFEATSLVKISQIKGSNIESVDDIKAIFDREITLERLHSKLGLSNEIFPIALKGRFDIDAIKKSTFVRIKGRGQTPEKSVEMVNAVVEILNNRHQLLFSEAEKTLNKEIETIEKNKEKTFKDIEKIKQDAARLEEDIMYYEKEISKRANVQSEGQGRIAESYINLLAGVKNQEENKKAQILSLEQQLINIDQQLQQKEFEKAYQTTPTTVEVAAAPPETRIAPNRTQNVMIAGILGLFIGIFYAFASEYFRKVRL